MQADTAYGSNRSSSRPRGPAPDRLDRRLRCDKGPRGSGRLDDCGSPCAGRVDPLLEEFKNNRTRKWEMRVRMCARPPLLGTCMLDMRMRWLNHCSSSCC